MLPITPKLAKRWVVFNATRKGLLGGSRLWLSIWGLLRVKNFAGKVTKGGEPQVAFSQTVAPGHWFEVTHEHPPAGRRAKKKAKKSAAKADARRTLAETTPTRRNINRALRAGRAAKKLNAKVGPNRRRVGALSLADSAMTRTQRRRNNKIGTPRRTDLEVLDALGPYANDRIAEK